MGGGIAAYAAAIRLSSQGVAVIVASRSDSVERVESLTPAAARWLQLNGISLGEPLREVTAWWGRDTAHRETVSGALLVRHGELRKRLMEKARGLGATIVPLARESHISRSGDGWQLAFGSGSINARSTIDATGRRASMARAMGARRLGAHELFCANVTAIAVGRVGTWTEAVPDGWWNLTSDGTAASLGFYSSAAAMRTHRGSLADLLAKTEHLRRLITRFADPVRFSACGSSWLDPCAGPGWVAIGDAAMTIQPLTSAGVAKAFREADLLCGSLADPAGAIERVRRKYNTYLTALSQHYAAERRWPESEFWRDRQVARS